MRKDKGEIKNPWLYCCEAKRAVINVPVSHDKEMQKGSPTHVISSWSPPTTFCTVAEVESPPNCLQMDTQLRTYI